MWFKRRKKSESDHALSESLKSLQTLLNESDRREPSLEPSDEVPESPRTTTGKPAAPRAAASPPGDDGQRDPGRTEPSPSDSASRWRDLNLSFDAEPVSAPRPQRDDDAEGSESDASEDATSRDHDTHETAPSNEDSGMPGEPDNDLTDTDPPVLEEPTAGTAAGDDVDAVIDDSELVELESVEPVLEEPRLGEPAAAPPHDPDTPPLEPPPADEIEAPQASEESADEAPEAADAIEPDASGQAAQTDTVVDFDAFSDKRPVEAAPAPAEDTTPDVEWDEPVLPTVEPADAETAAPAGDDDSNEDQLHLELEPEAGDALYDDIPTLTEAVYVPDGASPPAADEPVLEPDPGVTAATEEGPPEQTVAEAPLDASIDWCLEQLRTRFEIMKLDPLSPEQETQLRDTLLELLDDYLRDDHVDH